MAIVRICVDENWRRLLLALLIMFPPLWARDAGRAQEAQNTIDRRVDESRVTSPSVANLASDEALIVLRPRKIFTLQAFSSYRFTSNAFLSDEFRDHDHVLEQSVTAFAASRIAERLDVFANTGVFMGRYARNSELDYDGVYGELGATVPVDTAWLQLSYAPTLVFDRGFDKRLLALHEFAAELQQSLLIAGRIGVYPYVTISRTFADPDDFHQTAARVGADFSCALPPNLQLFGNVQGSYVHYDDFFEVSTLEQRRDGSLGMTIGLSWSPRSWATLYATAGIERQWSTVSANAYEELFATPSLSLYVKF